jgi:sugar/nucleoside kinase (ribokinase family)
MKRIAAIGTVNRDTIYTPDGVMTESFGGLLYTVLGLAALADSGTVICPVCNVGADVWEKVMGFLEGWTNIVPDGVRWVPERNNHVTIRYDARGEKEEVLLGGVPPLDSGCLKPMLDVDAVCVNFISGFELSLEAMQRLRRSASGKILMDFHSLSLGMDAKRRRFFRRLAHWREWMTCADVVQMNEREAEVLAGRMLRNEVEVGAFGAEVLECGPDALSITRGDAGSWLVNSDGLEAFPALALDEVMDVTGCGDVFLAGFTLEYIRSGDVRAASRFANRAAGMNGRLRGMEEVGGLGAVKSMQNAKCKM